MSIKASSENSDEATDVVHDVAAEVDPEYQ